MSKIEVNEQFEQNSYKVGGKENKCMQIYITQIKNTI